MEFILVRYIIFIFFGNNFVRVNVNLSEKFSLPFSQNVVDFSQLFRMVSVL